MTNSKGNKIYIQDWLRLHPYDKPVKSDFYYLRICNEVYSILTNNKNELSSLESFNEINRELACVITAYFEDLISEIGIWKAFIDQHHEMYGKFLPFYDLEDYYPYEINAQDIRFLIWYHFSEILYEELEIMPGAGREDLARIIFNCLDSEWDKAPVNEKMKKFISIPENETDFYQARIKFDWLVLNSYLFYYYGLENEINKLEKAEELMEEEYEGFHIEQILKEIHDSAVHTTVTHLLAKKGKDWLAWVLGKDHPLFEALIKMSGRKFGSYLYLKDSGKHLQFKHLASGKMIDVAKRSLELSNITPHKTVVNMSLVEWMGEWWFSGVLFTEDMNDEILLRETSNFEKASVFSSDEKIQEIHADQKKYFREFTKGKDIAFFETEKELKHFMTEFMKYYNGEMNKLAKEKDPSFEIKETDFPEPDFNHDLNELEDESNLIFFNPNVGLEILFGQNDFIPDKENPTYIEYGDMKVFDMISNREGSPELIKYLLENYDHKKLGIIDPTDKDFYLQNLDFLLRYYKPDHYHTRPQINMV